MSFVVGWHRPKRGRMFTRRDHQPTTEVTTGTQRGVEQMATGATRLPFHLHTCGWHRINVYMANQIKSPLPKPGKANGGDRLAPDKVAEARAAYMELRNVRAVATKCHLHWHTVNRYRAKGNWDALIAEADKKAAANLVEDVALQRAKLTGKVWALIGKYIDAAIAAGVTIEFDPYAFVQVTKLGLTLHGEPDTIGERRITTPEDILEALAKVPRGQRTAFAGVSD